MATADSVSRLYDQLNPRERLALWLEAMARGDQAEGKKLRATCPRMMYTMADADFGDRLQMSFDRLTVACIDLRGLWGEMHALHKLMASLDDLCVPFQRSAVLAFLKGVRYGRGLPDWECTGAKEDDEPDEAPPEDSGAVEEDELQELDDIEVVAGGDLDGRLAKVLLRSDEATEWLRQLLARSAETLAQMMLDVWEALDRFCRKQLGVETATLMRAWGFNSGSDLMEMMARYPQLKPREDQVAECVGYIEAAWVERFGAD